MSKASSSQTMILRKKRHSRVRANVSGTTERPRLSVFRSSKHIVAQVIDDTSGATLASASTHEGSLKSGKTNDVDAALNIGKLVAQRAKEKGITRVVFDRGGFAYHGRIAAVADGARQGGMEF